MAGPEVSKKVNLLGSWNEDVFTDEIVRIISARAKGEKGKKVKVHLNEQGVKLKRSRFLQDSKTTFYPIGDLRTAMKSPDSPQCVLFILTDPYKKYKIVALRCASDADAVHLTNVFAVIQKRLGGASLDLKKRDNGNWTLRERTIHNANRHVSEIFRDARPHAKEANGQLAHMSVQTGKDVYTPHKSGPTGKDFYTAHMPGASGRDFQMAYMPVQTGGEIQAHSSSHKGVYVKRIHTGNNNSVMLRRKNRGDQHDDDFVIETEVVTHPPSPAEIHKFRDGTDKKTVTKRREHASPNDTDWVPETERTSPNHLIHPSYGVVYQSTSRSTAPPQPSFYRVPPRTYEARMSNSLSSYYAHTPVREKLSVESEMIPIRIGGNKWNVVFDQRSLRSNASKGSKKNSSNYATPITIIRPIEETYSRPMVMYRRGRYTTVGYGPHPLAHRSSDYRYQDRNRTPDLFL